MPFLKIPINNYSFNEWRAEHLKSKFSGAALTVYSSHQHNYQVKTAEREKGLIFGSEWERRFWLCGPATHDTLEFSLRVQLRKRTCFGAWPWQWWKAKGTLKGEGKVNLTDAVGRLCRFYTACHSRWASFGQHDRNFHGSISVQAIHYQYSFWGWLCKEYSVKHVSFDRISLEDFLLTFDRLWVSSVNFLWRCV